MVLEINTYVWLQDLRRTFGRNLTLADVPAEVWDDVARPGIDAVWLMGVWERSPRGARIARTHPAMRRSAEDALPDLTDADIVGSAYCVRRYTADSFFGGDLGLAMARVALAHRDVKLVLDVVPNHTAPDHAWALQRPEYYVHGTFEQVRDDPASCIEVNGHMLACARDPHRTPWPDVVQLDSSSPDLRAVMAEQMMRVAERCDAVRCDMAMLVLDDVFEQTWGSRGAPTRTDGRGFWPTVIAPVKAAQPDFQFWAEADCDLEPTLLAQGFDACYDTRRYDRLVPERTANDAAASVTAVCTLPGVALLREGAAQGRRVRAPATLGRRPDEDVDHELERYVGRLLAALGDDVRRGDWQPLTVDGWPDNRSNERLLAWAWTLPDAHYVVVINPSDHRADGLLRAPWDDLADDLTLVDRLTGEQFARSGAEWVADGLYVALDAGGTHLFDVRS